MLEPEAGPTRTSGSQRGAGQQWPAPTRQLDVIEYLQEENRVLNARLGGRRIRFTDIERRRLARKEQLLGRKVLKELETLVTPDTLLRWYRELVASKWNYSHRRRRGRPRVITSITDLVVQMALENPSWGYTRIRGALGNLGHQEAAFA